MENMKSMDRFKETKIQMVMKLKKLTRRAAAREIARMEAEKRRTAEEEMSRAAAAESRLKEKRAALRRRCRPSGNISRTEDFELLSAEKFFGEIS